MPPAAPAASSVLRSAAVSLKTWATMEPKAPPVMMIGPSAPNGPPEPMETADDSGLSTATLGDMRLPPKRMASRASGMPWPRMRSEPNRAMTPTTRPPSTGMRTDSQSKAPFWKMRPSAGKWASKENWPEYNRLVNRKISRSSTQATTEQVAPMTRAREAIHNSRTPAVKSPFWSKRKAGFDSSFSVIPSFASCEHPERAGSP